MTKVVLITGASRGIGRYLAEYYRDYFVVIGGSRTEPLTLDVTNEGSVKTILSYIRREYGRLDILINNAGVASMNHSLLTPIKTVSKVLNTNVLGTFLLCREAAKLMSKNKFGRIVNLTSVAVPLKLEGEAIYAASKAAVNSLTQVLAREFADMGITVNAVGPAPVKTDLIKGVPEDKIKKLINRQAIHRFCEMSDISNVIDFFIREESSFVTGQIVYLGGV